MLNRKLREARQRTNMSYNRNRKVVDTEASLKEIVTHSFANFLYGLTSGLVIVAMIIGDLWVIMALYLLHKKNEVVTIQRMQYKSKLGRSYLYPIPSTLGFVCSYLVGEAIKNTL